MTAKLCLLEQWLLQEDESFAPSLRPLLAPRLRLKWPGAVCRFKSVGCHEAAGLYE